ncbi:hypothetical protein HPHPP30_0890 [Helicobacter pylori Hp P-30]|nr:hypothetical protein HPHPP30_0890 [Helicobacter pylori Hp P-30]
MRAIIRDYPRSLYLLNLKRLSSVFKQTPFLKRVFNTQTHN